MICFWSDGHVHMLMASGLKQTSRAETDSKSVKKPSLTSSPGARAARDTFQQRSRARDSSSLTLRSLGKLLRYVDGDYAGARDVGRRRRLWLGNILAEREPRDLCCGVSDQTRPNLGEILAAAAGAAGTRERTVRCTYAIVGHFEGRAAIIGPPWVAAFAAAPAAAAAVVRRKAMGGSLAGGLELVSD